MNKEQEKESIEREIEQLEGIIDKRKKRLEELNTDKDETDIRLPSTPSCSNSSPSNGIMEELPKR